MVSHRQRVRPNSGRVVTSSRRTASTASLSLRPSGRDRRSSPGFGRCSPIPLMNAVLSSELVSVTFRGSPPGQPGQRQSGRRCRLSAPRWRTAPAGIEVSEDAHASPGPCERRAPPPPPGAPPCSPADPGRHARGVPPLCQIRASCSPVMPATFALGIITLLGTAKSHRSERFEGRAKLFLQGSSLIKWRWPMATR